MTRDEFCQICEEADREIEGEPVSLAVQVSKERNLERAVFLYGSWNGGTIPRRELYRPTPGRQGLDCYQKANAEEVSQLAIGRLLRIMSRPTEEGDVEQYFNLRSIITVCGEIRRGGPLKDTSPSVTRQHRKGDETAWN